MDVVELIQDNLNPLVILNHYGFRHIDETEDSFRACCEIHKGNNPTAFIWNKSNNLWFCYTGDCYGGDVFSLIMKMENVDFITAIKRAASIFGLDITGMVIGATKNRIINEHMKWIELQKRKALPKHKATAYDLPYTKYESDSDVFDRFPAETIEHYDATFCKLYPLEESMLYNKLVIPIIKNDIRVGVALRDTTGHYFPKWIYQPKGLKTGKLLYNFDTILDMYGNDEITDVVLVEGIFDVWAYHQIGIDNVVAVFGSSLKEEQYNMLLTLPLNIIMSFDNDDAGHKCAKETAKKFKNKTQIYNVLLPDEYDPANCSKDQLMDAYLNRTLYV